MASRIKPGATPDYHTWRKAVLHAQEIGVDVVLGRLRNAENNFQEKWRRTTTQRFENMFDKSWLRV